LKCQLVIDADTLLYKAAFAAELEVEWTPDVWSVTSDLTAAKAIVAGELLALKERFRTTDIVLALTDSANWRFQYYPNYKANRKKTRKPVGFVPLRDWVRQTYKCVQKAGLEADDVCGWLATKPGRLRRIIVSVDKDLKTIPAWLFNPDKDDAPRLISKEEADYNHMYQTLVGDKTDNYIGCPGIGPVKARAILDEAGANLWKAVVQTFESQGLTAADAYANAAAARILRYGELDLETQKLIWNPND